MRLLLAIAILLLSAATSHAAPEAICSSPAVFFCDNFEDRAAGSAADLQAVKGPKTPGWEMSSGAMSTITVSTTVAQDGTKALAFQMPACSWSDNQNQGCGAGYMTLPMANRSDFYMRHYAYWPAGYVWSPVADKHIAFLTADNGRRPWAWHTHPGREPFHDDEPTGETLYRQNVGTPVAYQTGRWYCLEIHLKTGNGNAVIEGWIDGVKKWNHTNATLGTSPWNYLMLSGYWNTSSGGGSRGAQSRYFDNLVMSTQPIGCLGSPPPQPPVTYQLVTSATGSGVVSGAGSYPAGTVVTPVATAAAGSTFSSWSGDCTGGGACTVTMTADKSVTATFTTPTTPPPTTNLPPAPSSPSVALGTQDATGVTFTVAWPAVTGATSYSYTAGLSDNSATLQGAVTPPNLLLKTPYMANGAAGTGFVCIKSVNAVGSSAEAACNALQIPAKTVVIPPPTTGTLTVDAQISRCNYFLTAEPPDAAGGWVAQFFRDGSTKVGNPITAAPYKRSVELYAPSHSFSVQFTKTGSVMRSPAVVTRACP